MTIYRNDIDGVRSIAVLSVIFFHLGFLSNGYLGVDVFFVISGFLITKIVYSETIEDNFSIKNFYLRRIRRIIPLVLFCSLISLIVGLFVMLPDDLENLSQSIVATNFFANNILLLITTGDYWDLVNDFKPLMHTWSLGVEEQFYIFFPLIFMIFSKKKTKYILPVLVFLSIISFCMYLFFGSTAEKFYLLQYRFFELAIGGIFSILLGNKLYKTKLKFVLILSLLLLLLFNFQIDIKLRMVLVTFLTLSLLITKNSEFVSKYILENRLMVYIGKISFSLYMWHQIILAYARYFLFEKINFYQSFLLFFIIVIISIISFNIIEQPFRNKNLISNKKLIVITGTMFFVTTTMSFIIYFNAGIIKDVPELSIVSKNINMQSSLFNYKKENIHIAYNSRIYDLDKPFKNKINKKILVIGNSFARDWVNVLLETQLVSKDQISYTPEIQKCIDIKQRLKEADLIFFSELHYIDFIKICNVYDVNKQKVFNVGTKNFGSNNGFFYNKKHNESYCIQRTELDKGFIEKNDSLKLEWKDKFIDIIGVNIDKNNKVPVFTENCKFISQDCRHLTKDGALYYSIKLRSQIEFLLKNKI